MISELNNKSAVKQVTVSPDRAGQRLDNFLSRHMKGLPKSAIYRLIRTGQVRINGKRCKPDRKVLAGDEVRIPPIRTPESGEVEVSDAVIQQVRAAVLHEDQNYLVINKPSGMAVHSGSNLPWGLIDAVRQAWPGQYVELAHRIDRETSGCVVLAKNGDALKHLSRQFRSGTMVKKYLCLMDGHLKEARVAVDAPVLKTRYGNEHVVAIDDEGKEALTHFRLLHAYADCSYVEAEIFTGRTHQIRVHAAHLGQPLAGDDRYADIGSLKKWKARGLKRLFLHSHQLSFDSVAGGTLNCNAPLPDQLRDVLDRIEK